MTSTFSCRIQYLDDSNPFATANFPEPTRPLTYAFLTSVPLSNQIANIHTALNAPLKVPDSLFFVLFLFCCNFKIKFFLFYSILNFLNLLFLFVFTDRRLCSANLQAEWLRDRIRLLFGPGAVSGRAERRVRSDQRKQALHCPTTHTVIRASSHLCR